MWEINTDTIWCSYI